MEHTPRQRYRASMRSLFAYFGWQLVVDEEAFLDEVINETGPRLAKAPTFDRALRAATINRYAPLWYAACCADGTARQQRAFVELHDYCYRLALRRTDNDEFLASESAQEAVIEVWKRLRTVREPDRFIKWIQVITYSKVSRQLRKGMLGAIDETTGETIWQAREVTESDRMVDLSDVQDDAPRAPSLTDDVRAQLSAAIQYCLRSRRQQEAIIGFYLDGKEHAELAAQLGIDLHRLYLLKHRALARLRQSDKFMNVIDDLL